MSLSSFNCQPGISLDLCQHKEPRCSFLFPILVVIDCDLRTSFLSLDEAERIKAFKANLTHPWLCTPLSPTSQHLRTWRHHLSKGRGNLTSLALLKSQLLKYTRTTVALWPAVFTEESHSEPTNCQDSSLLCSIAVSRVASSPRSSALPTLFYSCSFMSGHI